MSWRELSDTERERQYSPSSCLPDGDYTPFVDEYRRASKQTWEQANLSPSVTTSVVRYGDAPSQTIDVAVPSPSGGRPPLLVFFHGGYWQELSKLDARFPARGCLRQGWGYAAVDYTLAPDATIDMIVEECKEAVRALHQVAGSLGVDRSRFFLAGSSAGAHLAAMAAVESGGAIPEIAGVVLLSGIFELGPLIDTSINDRLGLDIASAHRNSPLLVDTRRFPPALLAHGENETTEFKAQTTRFAEHLRSAQVSTRTLEIPSRNHFDVVMDLTETETVLGGAVSALIEQEHSDAHL